MIDKELTIAMSSMDDEESISFLACKIAEQEAKDAENKAVLARLNADVAKQLFTKRYSRK